MEVILRRFPSNSGSENFETRAEKQPPDFVPSIRRSKIRTDASDDPTARLYGSNGFRDMDVTALLRDTKMS